MKKYSFNYYNYYKDRFFHPIRKRKDFIFLILDTVEMMLLPVVNDENSFDLIIDKMNRVFYWSDNKAFSVSFPFSVAIGEDSAVHVIDLVNGEVDMRMVVLVKAMIERLQIESTSVVETLDALMPEGIEHECTEEELNKCWSILLNLLSVEEGYIRYDYDEKNCNGRFHPVEHLDVNYSSGATFKVGINGVMTKNRLIELLNLNTTCEYISN